MKKHHTISLILLALLLAVGFTILTHNFPFPGKTSDDFSLITGSSQTYTPEEIQDAADAVLHYFKGFSGATMTKLQYVAFQRRGQLGGERRHGARHPFCLRLHHRRSPQQEQPESQQHLSGVELVCCPVRRRTLEGCKPRTGVTFPFFWRRPPAQRPERTSLSASIAPCKIFHKFSHLVSQIAPLNRFIVEHTRKDGAFYDKPISRKTNAVIRNDRSGGDGIFS